MSFSQPWTEREPTDATFAREIDDYMRRLARAVRERLAVEHYAYEDETGQENVGKHRPGSAKILSLPSTGLPTPDPDAPGTLAEVTDEVRLARDDGSEWKTVKHAKQHSKDGDDPVTPEMIGAETPEGAEQKIEAAVQDHSGKKTGAHGTGANEYLAKTSRSDQWPDWNDIKSKPSDYPPSKHDHHDLYYTKDEADARYLRGQQGNKVNGALEFTKAGEGIILVTPDGTKRYKLTINNNGDLVTTLVS